MSFSGSVHDYVEQRKHRHELMRQLEKEEKAKNIVDDKKKSANERELIRNLSQKREDLIKKQLKAEKITKEFEDREKYLYKMPNVFKGQNNSIANANTLNSKNIFA